MRQFSLLYRLSFSIGVTIWHFTLWRWLRLIFYNVAGYLAEWLNDGVIIYRATSFRFWLVNPQTNEEILLFDSLGGGIVLIAALVLVILSKDSQKSLLKTVELYSLSLVLSLVLLSMMVLNLITGFELFLWSIKPISEYFYPAIILILAYLYIMERQLPIWFKFKSPGDVIKP